MDTIKIDDLLQRQRAFFQSGRTFPTDFRIRMLKQLKKSIRKHETEIAEALYADLGKSRPESYMCEIGMVLSELSYLIRHTAGFAKKRRVRTPLAQFASSSYTLAVPFGNTLIMSPWNYPFLLTMGPLADTIAAGNTAIVKPSAYSPATGQVMESILTECFPAEYVGVVEGGRTENAHLLEHKFDFVFFTGSQAVGREVLRHTAEHLTPTVLELGGKSPCIVDSSANIPLAAKRIVFGKIINCGQTCVAPDYILCEKSVKDQLVAELIRQIKLQLGDNPLSNPNYGHIINRKHFDRICGLIDPDKVVFGGNYHAHSLKICPTIMDNVDWDDAVMQEEIFGPILPILTFRAFEDVFAFLQDRPSPLAFYLFSSDKAHIRAAEERLRFGGGCINDTIIHLASSEMGFGGVGESGMGAYHGKVGFDSFSHVKSIVSKSRRIDLPMRYQPYRSSLYSKLIHFFLK